MKSIVDLLEGLEQGIKRKKREFSKKVDERRAANLLKRKHLLREGMWKAGMTMSAKKVSRIIFSASFVINVLISIYFVAGFSMQYGFNIPYILLALVLIWILATAVFLFVVWLIFYISLDIIAYQRKVEIEEVLPDFLQLTSANIRAGMTIDKALWFAVRPRFGVLAKEMEEVAKRTFVGEDLEVALKDFATKYDSPTLRRSIYLLMEGLKAGGEVGVLLDRISTNIQQIKMMKKEMAANVTTYVIFISVAVIVGAPFLFALSNTLIQVIQQIAGNLDMGNSAQSGINFSFSAETIKLSDFRIFAFLSLIVTSISASAIISTIQKGTVKAGLKYIPMFIVTTIFLFFVFSAFFSSLFSGMFS